MEPMEERTLLSGLMAVLGSHPTPHVNVALLATTENRPANGFGPDAFSPLLGKGTPSNQELARERFSAVFAGPMTIGPGRFSDQAKIIFMRGVGGSTAFLHGDYQMAIVIPTDPSAPITGEAYLEDKNNNSAGNFGLMLTAVPGSLDRFGRPTAMTFTADPNIYSGAFYTDSATGTVTIRYSKGAARATFQGRIYTLGLTNPLRNSSLVSRGGRINPRS
jgi:hypothetical protein